jgi:hypothetical protein
MLKPLKTDFRPLDRWLTFTAFLGPVAALANLTVSYTLVPESCERGSKMLLHGSAAAFFASCVIGAAIAWRTGRRLPMERTRWLAMAGVILCLFSALVIVAMEIPNVILRSCD